MTDKLTCPKNASMAEAVLAHRRGHQTTTAAAKDANVPWSTYSDWIKKAKKIQGVEDLEENLIQQVTGTSTLYDKDGEVIMEWVKTSFQRQKLEYAIYEAIKALDKDIIRAKPVKAPKETENLLASCYIVTDYHLGQLSWAEEAGEDWDTDIACDLLTKWFGIAIDSAPNSKVGILAQLGDFLHWDGIEAVTPTSRHVLDADTRFPKLVDICIRVLRSIVAMMLTKHEHVHVILAEGNHDIASSIWLRAMFATLFENEPRVTIDNTHMPYYCYEWGATSLFFHHGHKKRIGQISPMFAGLYREVFGRTQYSYAHMGHLHHKDVKENELMEVEQHPTLAAKDAHSTRGGYLSKRAASVITYSKHNGEVHRSTIRPEMIDC